MKLTEENFPFANCFIALVLIVLIILSVLKINEAAHKNRLINVEIHSILNQTQQLENEYSKLLLERTTLADLNKINKIAIEDLKMIIPENNKIQIIKK